MLTRLNPVLPQPELDIRTDGEVALKRMLNLMSAASKAGMTHIGSVTEPRELP